MAKAIPTPHYTTFFCARKNALHFSLSGAKKRHQPKTSIIEKCIESNAKQGWSFEQMEPVMGRFCLFFPRYKMIIVFSNVNEIKSILPSNKELGVDKFLYDLIVDYSIKELQKRLTVINYSVKAVNAFSDKDNVLTISSSLNRLQQNAIKLINITSLIIIGIIILFFFNIYNFYINCCKKGKKVQKYYLWKQDGYMLHPFQDQF